MTDNIRPDHYRKGNIDLYEAFSQIFPHNEYRAGMQMIALRYMFRDKNDRVEDIDKAMETLERLKEKEIEYKEKQVKSKDEVIDDAVEFMREHQREHDIKTPEAAIMDMFEAFNDTSENIHKHNDLEQIFLLKNLLDRGFKYLARDKDDELWTYDDKPDKLTQSWIYLDGEWPEKLGNDYFPEVKWTDDEPTRVVDLLETYSKSETPNTVKPKTAGQYLDEIYFEHEDLLKRLWKADYRYLARDENGELYAFEGVPKKYDDMDFWDTGANDSSLIKQDNFPEIKWSDEEPIKIADLLETLTGAETETHKVMDIKTAGEYLNGTYLDHANLLKRLTHDDYRYLARDKNGFLYAYDGSPVKSEDEGYWDLYLCLGSGRIGNDNFPEVQWSDEEPTKIVDLLDIYKNGGESGE